ncbi:hypothetical protein RJ641_007670 [Dillenia turbinata]|uniref:Uncharacterized protein n=1 Tax=Dillenia turbinata TaxID=194707 RepID=A0AAN8Z5S9_9MAGN
MDSAEGVWESSSPPRSFVDAHFNKLPPSCGLDVNMDRVEDVLLHQNILLIGSRKASRLSHTICGELKPKCRAQFVVSIELGRAFGLQQQMVVIIKNPLVFLQHRDCVFLHTTQKLSRHIAFIPRVLFSLLLHVLRLLFNVQSGLMEVLDLSFCMNMTNKLEDLNLDIRRNSGDLKKRYPAENISESHWLLGNQFILAAPAASRIPPGLPAPMLSYKLHEVGNIIDGSHVFTQRL